MNNNIKNNNNFNNNSNNWKLDIFHFSDLVHCELFIILK